MSRHVDDTIRNIQEYVYSKYIEAASCEPIDEEAACHILEKHFSDPQRAGDPDCFYPGILFFELGYEMEEKQADYFRRAKYWLERHRRLTQEEWDAVDDRLLDILDYYEEHGLEDEPEAPAARTDVATPHVVEQIDDNGAMMLVPSGTFLFGVENEARSLPAFYIDKAPITNRRYEAFCRATGYRWPKHWTDERFNHPDAPVVGVSMADATKFCRWVGKDLPTEEQWEKACRGSDGRLFPWGDGLPDAETTCHARDPDTGHTCPVEEHPDSASPFGVLCMAGNVWEWTSTSVEDGETVHILKGGCYSDPGELLRSYVSLQAAPKDKYENIGFRCVKTA